MSTRDDHLEEFGRFYERDSERLIRTVALVVGETTVAEDAVAEGFARAWARWDRVRTYAEPAGWVLHVALNETRTRFRRRRVALRKAPVVARPEAFHDPEPAASELWRVVARLPQQDRLLVALRYVADLSQQEIALLLGIPPGTVASGLHRARRALEPDLRPLYEEELL